MALDEQERKSTKRSMGRMRLAGMIQAILKSAYGGGSLRPVSWSKPAPGEATLLLDNHMDALTAFGLFAVTAMLLCYAMEDRSPWFVLAFAGACALGSVYGFLQGAWPFGVVEAIWAVVALHRWSRIRVSSWRISGRGRRRC
jgi:hypothetical protein